MKPFSLLLLTLFIFHPTWSQTKIEIEKRVKTHEVPTEALEDLGEHLKNPKKVKWYYQEDGDKKVFEAKFEQNSNQYSVEFSRQGEVLNVEVITKSNQIETDTFKQIKSELKSTFSDFKIRKIQREYLGEGEDLFEIISENEIDDDLNLRYEIEVNAKKDKKRHLYELLFNNTGNLISQRQVKLKSTDILDY
ncbi:MAG: hypothetical protein GVY05_06765 [Bacteroidetes bacterium]|nr:hypothetical protein [Bacteroidota bacterium]